MQRIRRVRTTWTDNQEHPGCCNGDQSAKLDLFEPSRSYGNGATRIGAHRTGSGDSCRALAATASRHWKVWIKLSRGNWKELMPFAFAAGCWTILSRVFLVMSLRILGRISQETKPGQRNPAVVRAAAGSTSGKSTVIGL